MVTVMKNRDDSPGDLDGNVDDRPRGGRSQAKTLYYCPDNVYGRWVSDGLFFTCHSHVRSLMFGH